MYATAGFGSCYVRTSTHPCRPCRHAAGAAFRSEGFAPIVDFVVPRLQAQFARLAADPEA